MNLLILACDDLAQEVDCLMAWRLALRAAHRGRCYRQVSSFQGSSTRFNVRFGSLADIEARSNNVRFTPESGH